MKELLEIMQAMQGSSNPKLAKLIIGAILLQDLHKRKLLQNLDASYISDRDIKNCVEVAERFVKLSLE